MPVRRKTGVTAPDGATCDGGACRAGRYRQTCAGLGKTCGAADDGCGTTLTCGPCGTGSTPTYNDGACATRAATCSEGCMFCASRPDG